jgi:hypothetical protein
MMRVALSIATYFSLFSCSSRWMMLFSGRSRSMLHSDIKISNIIITLSHGTYNCLRE